METYEEKIRRQRVQSAKQNKIYAWIMLVLNLVGMAFVFWHQVKPR